MSHRLLKVDCLLYVVPVAWVSPQDVRLGIVFRTAQKQECGKRCTYYAGLGPHRFLLGMLGQPLEGLNLRSAYFQAKLGWDEGTAGLVLRQDRGKPHLKISVNTVLAVGEVEALAYARANSLVIESLSGVLASAPRSDQPAEVRWRRPALG